MASQEEKVTLIALLSILSAFGTLGNALVLHVFTRKGNKVGVLTFTQRFKTYFASQL